MKRYLVVSEDYTSGSFVDSVIMLWRRSINLVIYGPGELRIARSLDIREIESELESQLMEAFSNLLIKHATQKGEH